MAELEQFGRYLISHGRDRTPISLQRVPEEVVCLGYSPETEGLVEVHVVSEGENFSSNEKASFLERAWTAVSLLGPCFQRIIDVDEFEGMVFYVTEVNDGEFLSDYIQRHGPMDLPLALALSIELTDSLIQLQPHYRLLLGMRLSNLLAVLTDGSYLTLRMIDLGLGRKESKRIDEFELGDPMREISMLVFYMLAGRPFAAGQTGQIERLAGLPSDLKVLLRHTLMEPVVSGPETLEDYRAELRTSLGAVAKSITCTSKFKPLAIPKSRHPRFALQRQVFSGLRLPEDLGDRFEIDPGSEIGTGPYALAARDRREDCPCLIQILPPSKVLPINHAEQADSKLARISDSKDSSLLGILDSWESEDNVFIAEEAVNGFSLQSVLIARDESLETQEVFVILSALSSAIREAEAASLAVRNLNVNSLQFHFPNESRLRVRELLQRHADCWPEFRVKLRCHSSLSGALRLPPIGRLETGRTRQRPTTPEALLAKAFVGIAEHLLVGPWPPAPVASAAAELDRDAEFREFFRESYESVDESTGVALDREAFLESLRDRIGDSEPGSETIVDGGILPAPNPTIKKAVANAVVRESGSAAVAESMGTIDDAEFSEPAESSGSGANSLLGLAFLVSAGLGEAADRLSGGGWVSHFF